MSKPITELVPFIHQMGKGVVTALHNTAERVHQRMSVSGSPIQYPVQWDSQRQRRLVMAKLRRENNLPYQRKGTYEASGAVTHKPNGSTLFKPHPAGAIGGTTSGWQSRIHRNRWPHLLTVIFDELSKLPQEISNQIKVLSG